MQISKPNVLMVVPRLNIGGAETYVLTTALGLKKRGYQVMVASWGGQLVKKLEASGINHFLVPIRLNAYLASLLLKRIIKNNNVQLVHANSAAAGFAARKACRELNLPLVYTAHGVFGHNLREKDLENADKVICVSKFLRKLSVEKGIKEDRLVTIYNGIDLSGFIPNPEQAGQMRQRLGIRNDEFVMGIVSRIKNLEEKGHGDILDMMAKYPQPNWRLVIIGKGRGLSKVKTKAQKLNLTKQICFVGHQTDVANMLQCIDVFLLPSKFETFGLVLAEAMAMAKPVVAYGVGGIPEAVEDNHTGFIIPHGNIDAMYEKIYVLSQDYALRGNMGQNGVARVKDLFDIETMLDKLEDIYQQVSAKT